MRIAAYMRKSVKGDENSVSIEAQLEIIKSYFKNEDCKFTIYKDDGFSGGNTNRPAFQKMIEDAMNNKYDVVACYKLDRMARNTLDFLTTFQMLQKNKVDLVCVQDNYDPRTPSGKMMMTLLASLAEMERENIKRRAIDGMYSLARQGRWSGGTAPLGCIVVNKDGGKYLEIENQNLIKYIFNEFSIGNSMYKISKATGLTTRNLAYALRNPIYIISDIDSNKYLSSSGYEIIGEPNGNGYMTYKHNKSNKDKMIELAVVSKNKGVIPSDTWIRVREKLKELEHIPPRISSKSWLAHKMICKECGATMYIGYGSKRKDGTRPLYFRCKKNCVPGLRVDEVESKMFKTFKERSVMEILNDDYSNVQEINTAKNIENKIKIKTDLLNGLIEKSALASNSIAKTMLQKAELISIEIEELNKEYIKYQIILNNQNKKEDIFKNKEVIKKKFVKEFNKNTLKDKQVLINMIIDKCVYDGENTWIH